jgi:hypothetical protein
MRMMLYEAAQSMLVRSAKWSWLKVSLPKTRFARSENRSEVEFTVLA